jgi:hypothetical protein
VSRCSATIGEGSRLQRHACVDPFMTHPRVGLEQTLRALAGVEGGRELVGKKGPVFSTAIGTSRLFVSLSLDRAVRVPRVPLLVQWRG